MTPFEKPRRHTATAAAVLWTAASLLTTPGVAAVETVADCRALIAEHPDNLDAYRCFWVVARRYNHWRESIDELEALLDEQPGQPRALLYLGMIFADRGEAGVDDCLRRAADAFAAEGESTGEVYALLGLAQWLDDREHHAEARALRERAARVATASGDQILLGRVRLAHAWQAIRKRDYALARGLFREVESAVFPEGPFDMQYGTVNGLGYADWATGRYRSALANYRRQATVCSRGGDPFEETSARYNVALMASRIARTAADIDRIDKAAREALDSALRSGSRGLEARLRFMLAQPHDGAAERRAEAAAGLAAARAAGIPELVIQGERHLAQHDLAADPTHPAQALERLQHAIDLAREVGNLHEETSGRLVLAGALWFHGRRSESLVESHRAIDLIGELRARQSTEEDRARIASTWAHAFYQPAGRLLETGEPADLEHALRLIERLRAHELVDILEGADAVVGSIPSASSLSLDTIRAALRPHEVLVSYQIADRLDLTGGRQGGSWAMIATRDQVVARALPDRREIEAAVEIYLGLIRNGDEREATAAHRIFDLVLGPVEERLDAAVTSLVIIPDGILAALPFAALRRSPQGPPLVDRIDVSIAPSVTRWLAWRTSPPKPGNARYLGIADPVVGDTQESIPALPHARAEVRHASRIFGAGGRALIGEAATEASVKRLLDNSRFQVVHFATHSEVDRSDPSHTAIRLGDGEPPDDGRLGIGEISSLGLKEPIVVLSACRSAAGVVLQGEGVLGLTRAFFEGGARSVVGNLWPVADRPSALFAKRFFRNLADGSTVAGALAAAQRGLVNDGLPTQSWAGFTVIGDGGAVCPSSDTGSSRLRMLAISAGAFLGLTALGGVLLARRRRGRTIHE